VALGVLLSVLVGVSLGMLGGGGSILTLPILVYAMGMDKKAAIATSLLVVGTTSAAAVISHARAGNVAWRTGLLFALAGSVGAFVGGWAADAVPATWLVRAFIAMMFLTAFGMLRGRQELAAGPVADLPLARIARDGGAVGLFAGLVGAGGGFLVVPALALLGGLTMHRAVGTSLLVIALQSWSGFLGHVTHVRVDFATAGLVTGAAVVGSLAGGLLAPRVPQAVLRKGFGILVLCMAVYMTAKEFTS
jgi:uncharacterized membrane protein YfcA